ncbi:MAG: hypothetical protein ACPGVU_10375 [Limisphaerales bacterium]
MKHLLVLLLFASAISAPAANKRPTERQAANVFRTYDKNGDSAVTVDEWFMMRHLKPGDRSSRAQLETRRFQEAEPSGDNRMTQKEFVYWYTTARFSNVREGGARGPGDEAGAVRRGPRDGEGAGARGPRDGEANMKRGPRDGEGGVRRGPRDGEGAAPRGPRDGEGGARGPADGEGGRSAESDGIVLNVNSRGQLLADGRVLSPSQRVNYLRRVSAGARGRKIYIQANRNAPMTSIQNLIRECQVAGMKNLFLSSGR